MVIGCYPAQTIQSYPIIHGMLLGYQLVALVFSGHCGFIAFPTTAVSYGKKGRTRTAPAPKTLSSIGEFFLPHLQREPKVKEGEGHLDQEH